MTTTLYEIIYDALEVTGGGTSDELAVAVERALVAAGCSLPGEEVAA